MRAIALMLAGSACVGTTGCAALVVGAAGGAAGTVYVTGQLRERLIMTVPKVHHAVLSAFDDLDIPVLEDKSDQLTANLESEFADGKHVWVKIEADGEDSAVISIRVGLVGDEARSRAILDAAKRHL